MNNSFKKAISVISAVVLSASCFVNLAYADSTVEIKAPKFTTEGKLSGFTVDGNVSGKKGRGIAAIYASDGTTFKRAGFTNDTTQAGDLTLTTPLEYSEGDTYKLFFWEVDSNNALTSKPIADAYKPAASTNPTNKPVDSEYDVTVATGIKNGTVSVSPTKAKAGQEVTVTTTPNDGYELDTITVKDANNGNVTVTNGKFKMPAKAVTVTATFKLKSNSITVAATQNGTVSVNKQTATMGEEVTITTNPSNGYEINDIVVTDAKNATVEVTNGKFTMPATNVKVTVTFKKIGTASTYTVSLQTPQNGTVTVTPTTAAAGAKITIDAAPDTGYELDAITVTDNITPTKGADGKYTFTMPAKTVTVTVTFKAKKFAVTVAPATNGTVKVTPEAAEVAVGETVTVEATPAEGYELEAITVTDVTPTKGDGDTYTFTMPAKAVTITATFKATEYNVTVGTATNGTVTVSKPKAIINEDITITAEAATGYEIDTITVKGTTDNATVELKDGNKFTMPAKDVTVTVTFKAIKYAVKVADGITNGKITVDKAEATMGATVTITAEPDDGYILDTVTVAPKTAGSTTEITVTNNKTFTMPAEDVTVSATFIVDPALYRLKTASLTGGQISYTLQFADLADQAAFKPTDEEIAMCHVPNFSTATGKVEAIPALAGWGYQHAANKGNGIKDSKGNVARQTSAIVEKTINAVTANGDGGSGDSGSISFILANSGKTVPTTGTLIYTFDAIVTTYAGNQGGSPEIGLTAADDGTTIDSVASTTIAASGENGKAITKSAVFKYDVVTKAYILELDGTVVSSGIAEKAPTGIYAQTVSKYIKTAISNLVVTASDETMVGVIVTAPKDTDGTLTVGNTIVKADDVVTITPTAVAGKKVTAVKVNGNAVTPEEGVYTYTVQATDTVITVEAEYDRADIAKIEIDGDDIIGRDTENEYTLTAKADDGTVLTLTDDELAAIEWSVEAADEDGVEVTGDTPIVKDAENATKATLTIDAAQTVGNTVVKAVIGDVSGTKTVEITDKTVYTVTADTELTGGSIAVDKTKGIATATVKVTVTPDAGYQLKTLKYNVDDTDTPITKTGDDYTFEIPEAIAETINVTAEFEKIDLDITDATEDENGTISFTVGDNKEAKTAQVGDTVTVVITPADNYVIATLTVVPTTEGSETTIAVTGNTFKMPAEPVTVKATFKSAIYFDSDFSSYTSITDNTVLAANTTNNTEVDPTNAKLISGLTCIAKKTGNGYANSSIKFANRNDEQFLDVAVAGLLTSGRGVEIEFDNANASKSLKYMVLEMDVAMYNGTGTNNPGISLTGAYANEIGVGVTTGLTAGKKVNVKVIVGNDASYAVVTDDENKVYVTDISDLKLKGINKIYFNHAASANGKFNYINLHSLKLYETNEEQIYPVTVNVKDNAETPEAIEGAAVTIKSGDATFATGKTTAEGTFTANLPAGTYTVDVAMDGYKNVAGTALTVTAKGANSADVTLEAEADPTFAVTVNTAPFAKVKLNAGTSTGGTEVAEQTATADHNGVATWTDVPAGTYTADVIAADNKYQADKTGVSVTVVKDTPVNINAYKEANMIFGEDFEVYDKDFAIIGGNSRTNFAHGALCTGNNVNGSAGATYGVWNYPEQYNLYELCIVRDASGGDPGIIDKTLIDGKYLYTGLYQGYGKYVVTMPGDDNIDKIEFDLKLDGMDWSTGANATKTGIADTYFAFGDTKLFTLTGKTGDAAGAMNTIGIVSAKEGDNQKLVNATDSKAWVHITITGLASGTATLKAQKYVLGTTTKELSSTEGDTIEVSGITVTAGKVFSIVGAGQDLTNKAAVNAVTGAGSGVGGSGMAIDNLAIYKAAAAEVTE